MIANYLYDLEQINRIANDEAALDAYLQEQDDTAQSLFAEGKFDGLIQHEPTKPEDDNYWDGYQCGLRTYWQTKLKRQPVKQEQPF